MLGQVKGHIEEQAEYNNNEPMEDIEQYVKVVETPIKTSKKKITISEYMISTDKRSKPLWSVSS